MRRPAFAGLALVTVALVASSCGAGSKPLTRAQLIARADPICRVVVREEDYAHIRPARVVRFASRLAAVQQRAYEQLSKLEAPPSLADDWQLILDGFRNSARDFRSLRAVPHPERESSRFEQLYGDVRKKAWLARGDGFKDCGHY